MIWYVVTDTEQNYRNHHAFYDHKLVLEKYAQDCCLMLHYSQVTPERFQTHQPWAICHSGGSAMYDEYDVLQHKTYRACITEWEVPQIGFCGGHQILASNFGSEIGPLRALAPGEPDLNPHYCPGQYKEWGVYPVRILREDPLFEGLDSTIRVQEYHSWEVHQLGEQLMLLASSENCRVQAFVHCHKPIYGVQFHPEQANQHYADGFQVLTNFFRIARDHAGKGITVLPE